MRLREVMAAREAEREGVAVSPDHIALTNGSMQGVTLLAEAFMGGGGEGEGGGENIVVTEELTYSGTIAAAMEATLLGVPSIALSQRYESGDRVKWKTAEHWGAKTVRALLKEGWPDNVLINVNFPDLPSARVRGIRAGKQGEHDVWDAFEERIDPRGRTYFWVGQDQIQVVTGAPGTDLRAINDGYVAVTPLHLDLTHRPTLTRFRKVFN